MHVCEGAPALERDVHNRFARTRSTGTDILRTSLSISRSVRIIAVGAEAGGVLAYPSIHLRRSSQFPGVGPGWCLELTVTQPQLHDCPRLDRPSVRVRSRTVFTALARQPVGGWAIVAAARVFLVERIEEEGTKGSNMVMMRVSVSGDWP